MARRGDWEARFGRRRRAIDRELLAEAEARESTPWECVECRCKHIRDRHDDVVQCWRCGRWYVPSSGFWRPEASSAGQDEGQEARERLARVFGRPGVERPPAGS